MKRFLPTLQWSQSVGLTGARLVGASAGLVSQIILARILGADELGTFYFASSAALLFGSIASFGYAGTANRLIVRYRLRRDISSLEGFVATAWKDTAFMATACIGLIVAAIMLSGHGNPSLSMALIAAAAVPAFAMLRVNGGLANALRCYGLSFLPDNLLRPLLFVAVLGAMAVHGEYIDVSFVLVAFSGLAIVLAFGQTLLLRMALRRADNRFDLRRALYSKPDRRQVRLWRGSGRLLVAQLLVNGMFADIIILLAGLVLSSAQLGVFGLATKLAFLLGFVIQVAHQIVMPAIAEHLVRRDRHGVGRLIDRTNALAIAVTGGGLAAFVLFGRQLLGLFGEEFQSGQWVLVILALTQLARAAFGPALSLLIAGGRQASSLAAHLLSPILFGLASAILCPWYGPTGAAAAALMTVLASGGWMAWLASRELGIRCDVLAAFTRFSHLPTRGLARETKA